MLWTSTSFFFSLTGHGLTPTGHTSMIDAHRVLTKRPGDTRRLVPMGDRAFLRARVLELAFFLLDG
eukprot:2392156-Prymnesium_polylepis.1